MRFIFMQRVEKMMEQVIQKSRTDSRTLYLDVLRVIGTFAVMMLHLSATGYKSAPEGSAAWVICWCYDFLSRFAVPVFVMISGALFLDPKRKAAPVRKNILRLLFVFAGWSAVYAVAQSAMEAPFLSAAYWLSVVRKTITGHYHMWYLYMIMGLYLAVPVLRPVAADRKLLRQFILLTFLLNAVPRLLYLIPLIGDPAREVVEKADIGFFTGYVGYFCLGYYLHTAQVSGKQVTVLAILAVVLMSAAAVLGVKAGLTEPLLQEKMPHVFVYSVAVFLVFKEKGLRIEKFPALRRRITKLASCTLGMYLLHPAVNFILDKSGLYALTFHPLFCVPLCGILVFFVSFAAILVMKKLPILKRFV